MKKITSVQDFEHIMEHKLDVVDKYGHKISYVDFQNYTGMMIWHIIKTGTWSYHPVN